jgi:hypothetical protein
MLLDFYYWRTFKSRATMHDTPFLKGHVGDSDTDQITMSLKYKNRLFKSILDVVPQAYSSEDTA